MKQLRTLPFRFSPRVAETFVPELSEATFGRVAHARKKYADLLLEVLCACAKDTEQKKVSLKLPEENIASTKLHTE